MKNIFLVLSLFSIVGAVDVKQVTTTSTTSFTTFNQRVAQIGATNYETFYTNSTLPVNGYLEIPATFKATLLGNSKFTSYNNTSHDTIKFLGGGWKFSDGCFGDSLTVLFAPGAVSEVRVEWFGLDYSGTVDNSKAIMRALNSMKATGSDAVLGGWYGFSLVFPLNKEITVDSTFLIYNKNNIVIDQNYSTLKKIGSAKELVRFQGCNHVQYLRFRFNGNNIATNGLSVQSNEVDGGFSTSFCKFEDSYIYNCTNAGIKIGEYDVTGDDGAVDRSVFTTMRLNNNKYNVQNYSHDCKHNLFINMESGGNTVRNDVRMERGMLEFVMPLTEARHTDGKHWAWYFKNGSARVFGGTSENAIATGNAGVIFVDSLDTDWKYIDPYNTLVTINFTDYKIRGRGTLNDTFATDGALCYHRKNSRPVTYNNCDFVVNPASIYNRPLICIDSGAGKVTSIGCTYQMANASQLPFDTSKVGGKTPGEIESISDNIAVWTKDSISPTRVYRFVTTPLPNTSYKTIKASDVNSRLTIANNRNGYDGRGFLDRYKGYYWTGASWALADLGAVGFYRSGDSTYQNSGTYLSVNTGSGLDNGLLINSSKRISTYGRFLQTKGANVSSANSLILSEGNYFYITGTTTIQRIATLGWSPGSLINIETESSLSISDSATSIGGYATIRTTDRQAYTTKPNEILNFLYDGSVWKQINGRKVKGQISTTESITTGDKITIPSTKFFYLGDSATSGTWRIGRDVDSLKFQRNESGTWITKQRVTP